MAQRQELQLFKDKSVVSPALFQSGRNFLTLVNSIQGTNPVWLVNQLLRQYTEDPSIKVIFVTFINPPAYYLSSFKNTYGKDLKVEFVNCFDGLFSGQQPVEYFTESVFKAVEKNQASGKSVVLLVHPEFLLASTSLEALAYVKLIHKIQLLSDNLLVVSSTDEQFIDFNPLNRSIEFKLTQLYSLLLARSSMVITVKPLDTGRAEDVTGNLVVCKGPIDEGLVREDSYLFQVKKNGVDLFY